MGTSQFQGQIWGARAEEWAELGETITSATHTPVFDRAGVAAGTVLLDVGCGAGGALLNARGRGAQVAGLDASEAMVGIARRRLPGARIEVGDIEALPFGDAAFEVVTGFNSLQFAGDRVNALREVRRVVKPGGRVVMLVWGRKEVCETTITITAVQNLLPPPPTPPGQPIGEPGVMDGLMTAAGLSPAESGDIECPFRFPDRDTALRTLRSAGVIARAEEVAGEERVVEAMRESLAPFTRPDGSVVQQNFFHWVMAERR